MIVRDMLNTKIVKSKDGDNRRVAAATAVATTGGIGGRRLKPTAGDGGDDGWQWWLGPAGNGGGRQQCWWLVVGGSGGIHAGGLPLFDTDGDGRIAPSKLGILIRSLGVNPMQAQLKAITTEEGLTNPFDFTHFLELMRKHLGGHGSGRERYRSRKSLEARA
ncbi:hypothetical protein IEQ34_021163 [Dendrobium chrysotoxum]|uniref:EF-hand domain-containing protein n=1 Tax=Dendrobium chrysotoxum TaxID=161865 RepID=A0AAV7G2U8_DENCH|nr:hypothetical protein IEQ34_021163 [Dendrobium chrysotoxum]